MWNVRGWWSKREEIKEKIKNYDIIILTEIKNKREQEVFKIPGYKMYIKNNYNNNLGSAGGVAIILRDDIEAEIMNDCYR